MIKLGFCLDAKSVLLSNNRKLIQAGNWLVFNHWQRKCTISSLKPFSKFSKYEKLTVFSKFDTSFVVLCVSLSISVIVSSSSSMWIFTDSIEVE